MMFIVQASLMMFIVQASLMMFIVQASLMITTYKIYLQLEYISTGHRVGIHVTTYEILKIIIWDEVSYI